MRSAISPRLAMSTRFIEAGRRAGGAGRSAPVVSSEANPSAPPPRSQRNVAMLLRRIPVPLRRQGPQRVDQPRPGVPGIDDVIDVAPARGGVGVGELGRVFLGELP